jgi:8-oxo-dGTP pyrophosphatase MutT (NUDIX family)
MAKSDRTTDIQYGALLYREGSCGAEIMLITSRDTGRWVIPKGWPITGKRPHRAAETEAFEEAGVKGVIAKKPIGSYPYAKRLPDGEERIMYIEVYPLRVTLEAVKWKEKAERKRAWFPAQEAADLVDEGGLAQIIEAWS